MTPTYWLEPDSDEADNIGPEPEVNQDDYEEYRRPACGGIVLVEEFAPYITAAYQNVGCPGCESCLIPNEEVW